MLLGLILPAAALALLLGVGGAVTISGIVERVNDRLLDASARSIADTLALEDGEVTLDLPQSAFGMLENDERDNVYYSVRVGSELLTGYPDLPVIAPSRDPITDTRFAYAVYRDTRVRVVSITRRVPRVEQPVVVQVAETLDARTRLRERMLTQLFMLEALLIGLLLLLLPIAVRWGLKPLAKVRQEIDGRSPTDFTPLSATNVPAELHGFLKAFNGLLYRLQGAVEGMRRFTADASHQMRTPLSILRAHLQVLRREGLDSAAGRSSLSDIDAATRRLQRLLTQLLALARAEGNTESVAALAEPVDICSLARSLAEDYVTTAMKAEVDLQFEADCRQCMVTTVEAFARELVANLVDNAIRYNHRGGTVWLKVEDDGETTIRVIVEDDGPGIPDAMRPRMFDRFRRLDRDRQTEGSGLGLAIVTALADVIGSEVRLAGRSGGGLRAEIDFPRAPRDAGRGAKATGR